MASKAKRGESTLELLRRDHEEEAAQSLEGRVAQLSNIPLSIKQPVTIYIPARHAEVMKAIAEIKRVSVQELFREGVEVVLDRYLKKPRSKKKTANKRRA